MTTPLPVSCRKPADVIPELIAYYQARHGGENPTLKWLAARAGCSKSTASTYRRAYYSRNCKTDASRERNTPETSGTL